MVTLTRSELAGLGPGCRPDPLADPCPRPRASALKPSVDVTRYPGGTLEQRVAAWLLDHVPEAARWHPEDLEAVATRLARTRSVVERGAAVTPAPSLPRR